MKKRAHSFLLILVFSLIIFNCSEGKTDFIINGKLERNNIDYLILVYTNYNENRIIDTLYLKEDRFFVKGNINGPTRALLKGVLKTGGHQKQDKNFVSFFLEPKKNYISLIEDQFIDIEIKGSLTQLEFKNLKKETKPIYDEITPLMQECDSLEACKKLTKNYTEINKQLNLIEIEWKKKLNKIKHKRLSFAWDNPNSYVGLYWVNNYFTEISLDSISQYCQKVSSNLKNGLYWNKLTAKIQKREPSSVGDFAPKFEKIDMNGKVVNLESFKGKYALLSFWASWCKPCREGNPIVKKLHEKYNSKGFEIISISLDENEKNWKLAIKKDSLDWHHILIGRNDLSIGAKYNVNEIPDYILINKEGIIIFRGSSNQKNELEKMLLTIFN